MLKPLYHVDNIPYFCSEQVNIYGPPDYYGYDQFQVIESRDDAHPLVNDYQVEIDTFFRPIHRYNRLERFTSTLKQLLGQKGYVPPDIITLCSEVTLDPFTIWNEIRAILKVHKGRKYYNCIPFIIKQLGIETTENTITNTTYYSIIKDFKYMEEQFRQHKGYFPNIRYIVLKLLQRHNVVLMFEIPLIRTKSKLESLDALFNKLCS
jgi:hypothetical protein